MKTESRNILIIGGLITAALIYVYPLFLPTPLLEPDEGLHATISQEMLEHDEWIVPTFRGEPFQDKPILYFWAQMVSLKWFGMTEYAVRFPGLMFGLIGALTTGLLAGRLFDSRVGLLTCLTSMTMSIPLALAQAAVHDVALVPWTNLALLCLWETERSTSARARSYWLVGASFMFGLAILTKALIGVAVISVGYGLFLLCSRTISIAACFRLGLAIGFGAVIASPWFIAMEMRIPGYSYYYFIERHVMGFATATQRHGQSPWFYYLPYVSLGAIPWVWYVVPMLRDEWRDRTKFSSTRPQMILLLCWLIGGLLFLSVAKSKLVPYALPLFPAMAILSAFSWHRFIERRMSDVSVRWFVTMVRSAGAMGIVVPFAILCACGVILETWWSATAWLMSAILSVMSAVVWRSFEMQRFYRSAGLVSVWVAGVACLVMTWPLQMFAESHSERSLAQWMNRQPVLPEHLILVGEKPASVLFYLSSDLRKQLGPEQITSKRLNDFQSQSRLPAGAVLAVTRKKMAEADAGRHRIPGTFTESVGQFRIYRGSEEFLPLVHIATRSKR